MKQIANVKRPRHKPAPPGILAAKHPKAGFSSEIHRPRGTPPPHPYSFSPGDRIGRDLTVIAPLAVGRWSEIYQVWSEEWWCAFTCKILSARASENLTARAAMHREHRILRRLHHPNIVRVFGAGEHNGLPYLILEYVEGPSVLDVLSSLPQRRMAVADAVRIAIHAGSALAHLHRSGFLHLDLKPANLLLREGVPVLLDMDAARAMRPARALRSSPGTMPYMAPEQVLRLPLDQTADVYGLGTILYELLTGRWPFEDVYDGEDTRAGLEGKYPQIGLRPPPFPHALRVEIPPSLDGLVMRALARNPRDRFQTIPELLNALASELKDPCAAMAEAGSS